MSSTHRDEEDPEMTLVQGNASSEKMDQELDIVSFKPVENEATTNCREYNIKSIKVSNKKVKKKGKSLRKHKKIIKSPSKGHKNKIPLTQHNGNFFNGMLIGSFIGAALTEFFLEKLR